LVFAEADPTADVLAEIRIQPGLQRFDGTTHRVALEKALRRRQAS
jgi:hypothetical protein